MSFKNCSVVLIDLDDTLLDFGAASRASLQDLFAQKGRRLTGEEMEAFEAINGACWKALERGEITRAQLSVRRFAEFLAYLGMTGDPMEYNAAFRAGLAQSAVLLPGAMELCRALRGRVELYVVTNGFIDTQMKRIRAAGLEGLFDGVFASQSVGCEKPGAGFFDAVFDRIGREKRGRTVILGDSLSSDMRGGKAYGLATCWFNPAGKPDTVGCDYEIRRLGEFLSLLGLVPQYRMATPDDIGTLCDMVIDFLREKRPDMTEAQARQVRAQRTAFLQAHLNRDIFGYLCTVDGRDVASAHLHVIEQPANLWHINGRTAMVLNVYTAPDVRRLGYAEGVMRLLMEHAATLDLSYIDLQAAPQGRPLYEKLGFAVQSGKNVPMRYSF